MTVSNAELDALDAKRTAFAEPGATLVAVSRERPVHLQKVRERLRLAFDVLHDPGLAVAERYGLSFTLSEDTLEALRAEAMPERLTPGRRGT